MEHLLRYDRPAAVAYAHRWAYGRNPRYYDYERVGGDCTSFASQCLYAGAGIMNFTRDLGWYYLDGNHKAPAWTGVPYFYRFLTRSAPSRGPVGVRGTLSSFGLMHLSLDILLWWWRWAVRPLWTGSWWRPTARTRTSAL